VDRNEAELLDPQLRIAEWRLVHCDDESQRGALLDMDRPIRSVLAEFATKTTGMGGLPARVLTR
jgi:hypothetical protein